MSKISTVICLSIVFGCHSAACHSSDSLTITVTPGEYSIKTEIAMPNLKENLRYATTHTKQCLHKQDAFEIFPILQGKSFNGCDFVKSSIESNDLALELVCDNSTAATGSALIIVSETGFRGTLDVKMGGKNMKFTQQVTGHRISSCN